MRGGIKKSALAKTGASISIEQERDLMDPGAMLQDDAVKQASFIQYITYPCGAAAFLLKTLIS